MKHTILLFFVLLLSTNSFAQDSYHSYLNNLLTTDYNLPQGEWVFSDSETSIYQAATNYGGSYTTVAANNQVFSQKVRATIGNAGTNPWDAGWKLLNPNVMRDGDKILAVFFLRSVNGEGMANFFVENNSTFSKEVYLELPVSEEWRRYIVPFESMANYAVNACGWGFHLARAAQTIEIGGFTAINFGSTISLDDLPSEVNNQFYGGYEAEAPWRAEAATRIEQLRKADLTVKVIDSNDQPIPNAAVEVSMIRHNFQFGSAVVAARLANNPNYNVIYENKIRNLDGRGHGFNTVVFENDLKWDGWEEEWYVNKTQLQNAVAYLREHDIDIRGHNLVWPGNQYLPNDIPQNYGNLPYIHDRIMNHIETIMTYPGIGSEIHDWDVINEIAVNQDVANAFSSDPNYTTGRELYVEIFEKARQLDPNIGLWLNDYVTMTLNNTAGNSLYERFKQYAGELITGGADLEGIGFQGHIGGFPNSIYDVLGTLDDFHNSFGLKAKITEFDLPSFVDEELAGNYLRDFMTAIYSHPSTDGFLFWSFWDGQTYMNAGTNLYRQDWSETPSHTAFVDLLFNQWWTEELVSTANDGLANTRVFKGLYEIRYECDGNIVLDTVNITDALEYEITCNNITTKVKDLKRVEQLKVFPNPSQGSFQIERTTDDLATIKVIDAAGLVHFQTTSTARRIPIELSHLKGVYLLEFQTAKGTLTEKLVIQ